MNFIKYTKKDPVNMDVVMAVDWLERVKYSRDPLIEPVKEYVIRFLSWTTDAEWNENYVWWIFDSSTEMMDIYERIETKFFTSL